MISRHRNTLFLLALTLAFGLFSSGVAGAAQLYRWVDESGKVHYSDKIPPDQAKLKREALNKQGVTVDVIPGAKTPEQIAKEQKMQKMREEQEKLLAEQRARDETLLRTYRTEEDLVNTMEAKLQSVQNRQHVIQDNLGRLTETLASMQGQAAEFERNGQPVPKSLIDGLAEIRRQISNTKQQIADVEKEKTDLKARFDAERARYVMLTQRSAGKPGTLPGVAASKLEGLFVCRNASKCGKAWEFAKAYVEKNTTTGLMVATDSLIYTRDPEDSRDVALSVSKIRSGTNGAKFFLDARCQKSSLGEELCASRKISDIRAGFKPFIEAELEALGPEAPEEPAAQAARPEATQAAPETAAAAPEAAAAEDLTGADTPGLFLCSGERLCAKAWKLAKRYVDKNATTIVKIDSDKLIYTEDPAIRTDVAITVNRVRGDGEHDQLLLDVRCWQNGEIILGADMCASEKILGIRAGFKPFIEAGLGLSAQQQRSDSAVGE